MATRTTTIDTAHRVGAILMATSTTANAQAGMFYLATYSLGLALPFLASTLLLNRFSHYRGRLGK